MVEMNLPKVENLQLEIVEEHILIAKIHREEARNAMDEQTWDELAGVIDFTAKNDEVYVLIITGGEKLFAAGADIRSMNNRTAMQVLAGGGQELLMRIEQMPKPVIAAVGGFALGGGCELAMACDIRVAGERAKFGQPEVNLGLIPGAGGTQRLSRLVGYGKAKELIFTGAIIDAREAMRIGLVNQVVPEGEVVLTAVEMAKMIIKKGPLAVQLAKLAVNISTDTDRNTGMLVEKLTQAFLFSTEDRVEGTNAFIEKRSPDFKRR